LRIPGLAALGVTAGDWGDLIPLARRASSMRGNPLELTEEELTRCLALASE
jgi:hypothetical protein